MEPTDAHAAYSSIWSLIAGSQAKDWSRLLVRDHASPQDRLALFQSCRDGRDLVLGEAEHAVMTLGMATDGDPAVSLRPTAPCVMQLTSLLLVLAAGYDPMLSARHLSPLFNPGSPAMRLHTLHAPVILDDTLLGLLLECAPALTHIKVDTLQLTTSRHTQSKAAWQELRVQVWVHLSSLAHMPLTTGMKLITDGWVVCDITTEQAASKAKAALARFKEWVLNSDESQLAKLIPGVDVADEPAALRVGFSLLHALPARFKRIGLAAWVMSRELVLELQGLPAHLTSMGFAYVRWVEQPQAYMSLLSQLPDSVRLASIIPDPSHHPTPAHYESICLGAPRNRTRATRLDIVLDVEPGVVEAIQSRMGQLGVYPNVVVRPRRV